MRLPEWCQTHSLKEFMELVEQPIPSDKDCKALGLYNTPNTGTCECEEIQGNLNCKLNPF